ncbi:post-transcriptional regulator [Sporosarcina obsidiansis]|uniref:post-transcriptional regulator n=1 Tax=Sporosarcina obsidiansis TaxID=2660748 RepID=UPI00129B306A|nr:post-transcriptional regulator [Sporosarcina obsidiansis]
MDQKLQDLYKHVFPALESKKNEFHLYGYTVVTEKGLWDYLVQKKWRRKEISSMRSYEIVQDLFKLSPAQFMTYTQTEAQRNSSAFPELSDEERAILFSPRKID